MARRLGISVDPAQVAACVGTKELVAGVPQWLKLRRPDRDTVLYPAIRYPTYAMGATLAGCRAVPLDRKSVGSGKSVSVRVVLVRGLIITKTKHQNQNAKPH